ncbi:GNAT family N-acetyltransferase [Rhodoluna lacicola]|jgi:L-amino acid N-acyltransferase YncA|uniref:Sortase-related acyltransferase n=1 Tax=Rhodoluna lacicola TaxID=529884 RepID=A0A060JNH8_9MICO|nr:GNAT family N-acetyltransferase [Rhodoluna lacicola]AIC47744.1 Sortase-related acyltransferase [Rhodoluna lacicola]BDS50643.1 N-acetyltransferase [Rhodoluna lacicola]
MALDSESRWRLVRMKKAKGEQEKTNAEPVIRKASEADLSAMVEIYNYYIQNSVVTFDLDPMSLQDWTDKYKWITDLGLPFIVAESASGQIIGFAYVAPWRQKAAFKRTVEDSIYLRPAAIGKRVGTKLLTVLLEQSKAAGVKEIVAVISDKGAESSIALHERFGFKHQGHLGKVGFKFGRWLGTVLMQKSL